MITGKINFSAKVPSKCPLKLVISEEIFHLRIKNLYLRKGIRIVIGGRISTGSYKDKDGFMEVEDGANPFN